MSELLDRLRIPSACYDGMGECRTAGLMEEAADLITALEAEIAAERVEMTELVAILPNSTYLDPPDGGSVTIIEQFKRMALDAERYRWVRANCLSVTDLAAKRICASDEAIDKARGES